MPEKTEKIASHIRLKKICELLREGSEVSIREMSEMFGVSEMTIHRDLNKLQEQGHIRRTHGGAMPAERMEFEFDFAARRNSCRKMKQSIAVAAVKFIKPGDRIILDTGTTTLELAYLLKDFESLMVVTPSLAVASVLQFSTGVETVLLGGAIMKGSCDLTGVITEAVLDMFAVDIAFQGADGIGTDGRLYTADMRIAKVDQKIRERAARNYVLCDSSKIGKTAFAANGFVHEVDALITDDRIRQEDRENFEKKGATIIVV